MTSIGRPTFILTLRADRDRPGGPPAIVRLRRLLKCAGRSFGLKCIHVAPGEPGDGADPDHAPPQPDAAERHRAALAGWKHPDDVRAPDGWPIGGDLDKA